MNPPDDDLRRAFQHWRAQEAEEAPVFPMPAAPSAMRPQPGALSWLPPALAIGLTAVVVLVGAGMFGWHRAPKPALTLAEALPHPLLQPASPDGFALTGPASLTPQFNASDFLLPPSPALPPFP